MALLALAISPAYGAASNSGVATGVTVAAGGDISAVYNGDFAVGGDGLNFAASGAAVAVDIAATNNADPVVALDGATDNITVTSTQGNQAWHLAIKATDFENGAETVTLTPEATDTGESAIEISTINVTNEALNDTGCDLTANPGQTQPVSFKASLVTLIVLISIADSPVSVASGVKVTVSAPFSKSVAFIAKCQA
jgi:hypothetical protein